LQSIDEAICRGDVAPHPRQLSVDEALVERRIVRDQRRIADKVEKFLRDFRELAVIE
jgi:hypothetical protein